MTLSWLGRMREPPFFVPSVQVKETIKTCVRVCVRYLVVYSAWERKNIARVHLDVNLKKA